MSTNRLSQEAVRYAEELGWWLTFVRGHGDDAKAPLFLGWPNFLPGADQVRTILEFHGDAQIGVNLGASKLIDVEADTPEGEKLLDELCHGIDFPCWQSRRGKHRLFLADEEVVFLKTENTGIEFRTGRHQSVLPPSIIDGFAYEWIINPFSLPVQPLTGKLREFFEEQKGNPKNHRDVSAGKARRQHFPFRDDRDYVLRHFDLFSEAEKAGLQFVLRAPDTNGNIPCFVPAILRGGNQDQHASGLFNIHNGVLRDFATGTNHRFFRVLEALTGEPWQNIFDRYAAEAVAVHGRPHSRRVSYPGTTPNETQRRPLEEVRADLAAYYDQQLDRPPQPKVIHVIKGPPGVGKTFTICKKLGERNRKAIILTLENKLARTHQGLLTQTGNIARRMPVLREDGCIHPDDYEATSRRGFKASQSFPCQACEIGPSNCPYLLRFRNVSDADQLCAAAIYHTHDGFYASHGNENRPILVFDENCIDLLLEPVSTSLEDWQAWMKMIRDWNPNHELTSAFNKLVSWLEQIENEFRVALDPDGKKVKFQPFSIPSVLRPGSLPSISSLEHWLDRHAYKEANRHVQNLLEAAFYLLLESSGYVLLERITKAEQDFIVIRFRKKNPLPEDKEVFVLDATLNEDLIRAIAPADWDIRVWNCPPIEQAGHVIQIMDYDVSRNRIRKEIARSEEHNPSWLVQVVDAILAKHAPASVISFKDLANEPEMDLLSKLKHRSKISEVYNFPCRGHTFEDDCLVVIGTPYKDQASIWELALAIWGEKGLPSSDYAHRQFSSGDFIAKNMAYEDDHLKPLQDFIVSADLVQAIGRVRPLQRKTKVFVLSNAPISDWEVQQCMASELFDLRQPLRLDAADRYSAYLDAAQGLLIPGRWITNREISQAADIPARTGQGYWQQLQDDLNAEIEVADGKIRRRPELLIL